MFRTDNPAADWDAHCAEQERELARFPICSHCEEPICENCMDGHRVFTDDFME